MESNLELGTAFRYAGERVTYRINDAEKNEIRIVIGRKPSSRDTIEINLIELYDKLLTIYKHQINRKSSLLPDGDQPQSGAVLPAPSIIEPLVTHLAGVSAVISSLFVFFKAAEKITELRLKLIDIKKKKIELRKSQLEVQKIEEEISKAKSKALESSPIKINDRDCSEIISQLLSAIEKLQLNTNISSCNIHFYNRGVFNVFNVISREIDHIDIKNVQPSWLSDDQYHYYLGTRFLDEGELEKAKREFTLTIQYNPDYVDAYFFLGEIGILQKHFSESLQAFKKVLFIDDRHWLAPRAKKRIKWLESLQINDDK